MTKIHDIKAREILDSRGHPTIAVDVHLTDGTVATSSVPSGASTGANEAVELRDCDPERYDGKGVQKAIENIHKVILPEVIGITASDQFKIDRILIDLDGTKNKRNLGANAILGVSMSNAKAAAVSLGVPLYKYLNPETNHHILPVPMLNIINGGKHADNSTDIQEFMIVPAKFSSFQEAMRGASEVYHTLRRHLARNGHYTTIGDEGGFAPRLNSNHEALDLIMEAIKGAGYKAGEQFFIALDVAASEIYDKDKHRYRFETENRYLSSPDMIALYKSWVSEYPIISIEDGLAENEWSGWKDMTRQLGENVQLVGDDLLTTDPRRITEGVNAKAANAVLIKPNQIGTLTETFEAIELAKSAGWATVVSHRSGETADTIIADLAVATHSLQIKAGAPARGERTEKYNRLIKIETDLGTSCRFAGTEAYSNYQAAKFH